MWLPADIAAILQTLEQAGWQAWLVGGCVRDRLLGRPIHDWDLATDALPQQVMALFPHCIPTGLRHGTVTVLMPACTAEITTFRSEGAYADGRHPEQVTFVPDLAEDLQRRDFTINAMAMNRQGVLVDLFQGQQDLMHKTIRCVGDPTQRFCEDALRMLRAIRFSAQLDFQIEAATLAAIASCAALAQQVSTERLREEVEKTLLSAKPQAVASMSALGLLQRFSLEGTLDCSLLQGLPAEPAMRWAGLLLCSGLPDLEGWRLPKALQRTAQAGAAHCSSSFTEVQLRQLIAQIGIPSARITAALCGITPQLEAELASGHCLSLAQLAISARDLPWLHGPQLGKTLQGLLQHVLEHPEDNQRETLLALAVNIGQ